MEEVGKENIFIFGLEADEVIELRKDYDPESYVKKDPYLEEAISMIRDGFFSPEDIDLFKPIVDNFTNGDYYMNMADFESYHQSQMEVDKMYQDQKTWTEKAIINVASMGKFSSDRTINEYNRDIWKTEKKIIK
jgi:starch phosphorylase